MSSHPGGPAGTHPTPRKRPGQRTDRPPNPNPRPHPVGRQAFAACDLHLPDMLREAHSYEAVTLRWRVSQIEEPDPHYSCQCTLPAHWFLLQLPTEGE